MGLFVFPALHAGLHWAAPTALSIQFGIPLTSHHFCYPHSMKTRLLLSSLLVLVISVAKPQATKQQVMTPTLYELSGGTLHITYSTTSKNGQPFFSYDDGSQKLTFKGQEIQEEKSAIGVLVTVRTHMTTDAGSSGTITTLTPPTGRRDISVTTPPGTSARSRRWVW